MMSAPQPYPTVGANAPAPDDAQIEKKMPSICVDYLSHNWAQEDVWQSWKAMTKRKNEIANGVRLENASWRTWAKQRGNLKTINPETLNWLKDSDVTWLYGPLHEHADPVPPPKVATAQERLDLDDSVHTKSILKHRTISEMLTTPGRSASPAVEVHPSMLDGESGAQDIPKTTILPVNKSDTNLAARKRNTGGSPPASTRLLRQASGEVPELNGSPPDEKRHISFNTRVDQCIAVDYHEPEYAYSDGGELDDGSEEEEEEESNESDDGEVLTMRSNRSTSPPSRQGSSSSLSVHSNDMPSIIAKLAPTRLKTTDVYPAPSPAVVDPSNFAAQYAAGSSRVSSQPQTAYGTYDDDEPRSAWEEDSGADYFNAPFLDGSQDEDDDDDDDDDDDGNGHFSIAATPGAGGKARSVGARTSNESDRSSAAGAPSASSASSSSSKSSAPTSAATHEPAQPRSILKRRNNPTSAESGSSEVKEAEQDVAPPKVGANSAFLAANNQASTHDVGDSDGDDSGRGRTPQRLGSSASYERLQDASRRSAAIGTATGTSPSSSAEGSRVAGPNSPPERERRGSFRGRDGDGQQRSGAAARLNLGSPPEGASGDIESSSSSGRPSMSDDDLEWDARGSGRTKRGSKGRSNSSGQGSSMSPAGSQRLSVDLDNLPSNDPSVLGAPPTSGGLGGPTPLNTPTLALARSRSKSLTNSDDGGDGDEDHEASKRGTTTQTPSSPVMPRRTSATGALVAPSDADRQAGVRVPLADDYVEEDEGGIVGRAVEIVNTARDLIAAVWPRSR